MCVSLWLYKSDIKIKLFVFNLYKLKIKCFAAENHHATLDLPLKSSIRCQIAHSPYFINRSTAANEFVSNLCKHKDSIDQKDSYLTCG